VYFGGMMLEQADMPCYCNDCEWQGSFGDCVANSASGVITCPSCGSEIMSDYVEEGVDSAACYTMVVDFYTINPHKVMLLRAIINFALYLLRDRE